jgi:hypothetical protein
MYDEEAKKFIYQDVSQLVKELPTFTKKTVKGITDLGAFFAKITGKGRALATWKMQTIIVKKPISRERAIAVAKKISGKTIKPVEKEETFHFRVNNPDKFNKFRTKKLNDNLSIVFGKLTADGGSCGCSNMSGCGLFDGPAKDIMGYTYFTNPYTNKQTMIETSKFPKYIADQKQRYEMEQLNEGHLDFEKLTGTPKEKAKKQYDFYEKQQKGYKDALVKVNRDLQEEKDKEEPNKERLKKIEAAQNKVKNLIAETQEILNETKMLL